MGTIIGPIDLATWYSMRQCRESINYLSSLKDPKYQIEIAGEQDILDIYMSEILGKKAA